MGRVTKTKIGDKYVSTNGVSIYVKEYISYDNIIMSDLRGNTKKVGGKQLIRGMWWPHADIVLACGVKVYVVSYLADDIVLVEDEDGNQKAYGRSSLFKNRNAKWPWNPDGTNTLFKHKIGDKFVSKSGLIVTVESFGNIANYYNMVDNRGNRSENVKGSRLIKENMIWPFMNPVYPDGVYVYIAYLGETPYYVGSGKGPRYQHINSGHSHSRLLNQHLFCEPEKLRVEIYKQGLDRQTALDIEQELLDLYKPAYNVFPVYPAPGYCYQ